MKAVQWSRNEGCNVLASELTVCLYVLLKTGTMMKDSVVRVKNYIINQDKSSDGGSCYSTQIAACGLLARPLNRNVPWSHKDNTCIGAFRPLKKVNVT